jgi:membrane fusion protein (multidrug efflux system)
MARLNLERQEKVYEENGISELQYKNLVYARDGAKANADLMKARLQRTLITAPVDGVLEHQFFDEGEFAPPGIPIAHVVSTKRLNVEAEIPEKYAGTVFVGAPALLTFDAYPGDSVSAEVSYVSATVDASNRSLMVEIVIPSKDGRYKSEMIARVRILRQSTENALVVNENVVQLVDMNKQIVYVEKDGIAHERIVRIGGRQNSHVQIIEGLQPGDRVIVTDVQKLVDGLPVAVAS